MTNLLKKNNYASGDLGPALVFVVFCICLVALIMAFEGWEGGTINVENNTTNEQETYTVEEETGNLLLTGAATVGFGILGYIGSLFLGGYGHPTSVMLGTGVLGVSGFLLSGGPKVVAEIASQNYFIKLFYDAATTLFELLTFQHNSFIGVPIIGFLISIFLIVGIAWTIRKVILG